MELSDAVHRAMADSKVMNLDGYFLASVFSIVEEGKDLTEWTLLFYNPRTKKTRDCFVNDKFVTLEQEVEAQKELAELDTDGIKVGVSKAISTARELFHKKALNILISLYTAQQPAWKITFVATDITATSFEIDACTGKVLKEETTSLMKRLRGADYG